MLSELTSAFLAFLVDIAAAPFGSAIQTLGQAKRAWEQMEASLTEQFAWIGPGEIRALTRDPEVQRELQLARDERRRPNSTLLEHVLVRVLRDASIDLRGRSAADVIHRFVEEYYARFSGDLTAVVVGYGIATTERLDRIEAGLHRLSGLQMANSGESCLVEMQRTALQRAIATPLDLAKAHLESREFRSALLILERLAEESDFLGWTDDLRYYRRARLGCCLLAMGRDAEALDHFSSALSIRPGDPIARNNLLVARHTCGESPEDLLREVDSILREDPSFSDAICTKASLLLTLGRPQEAIDLLDDQERLRGKAGAGHDQILARACQAAGDRQRADDLARACLDQNPDSG